MEACLEHRMSYSQSHLGRERLRAQQLMEDMLEERTSKHCADEGPEENNDGPSTRCGMQNSRTGRQGCLRQLPFRMWSSKPIYKCWCGHGGLRRSSPTSLADMDDTVRPMSKSAAHSLYRIAPGPCCRCLPRVVVDAIGRRAWRRESWLARSQSQH
ncbi:hypothetical protein BU16DRAFT_329597 [Lophium mytilinum]|uniref:Uncharacterized protein n=1 Tax=Lophium mytilinum TaxID=390894 RepID=A0A6A6R1W2_9PEZI|nr:hypothetical protein BU16DRAFT_329597 [Lophium mytilinum]